MKKSLLTATIVVGVLLVAGLLVGGCSLRGGGTTSTSSSTTSSTALDSSTSTSTTLESTSTSGSSTTEAATSTTAVTTAGKVVRYQQNDSHFKYTGRWTTSPNAAASGGSFAYANSTGAKVTITFVGTHLSLIAKTSSKYGKAIVTLDGKKLGTIDLYSTDAKYQRKVWGTGTLKAGTHTVTITWAGTKRNAASATNINIDAVLVTETAQ